MNILCLFWFIPCINFVNNICFFILSERVRKEKARKKNVKYSKYFISRWIMVLHLIRICKRVVLWKPNKIVTERVKIKKKTRLLIWIRRYTKFFFYIFFMFVLVHIQTYACCLVNGCRRIAMLGPKSNNLFAAAVICLDAIYKSVMSLLRSGREKYVCWSVSAPLD